MKIIAYYLPQFHTFPENDKWWGEGYTEWVGVKNAKPIFKDHYQPRIPLKQNYYDLTDVSVLEWQASIAKKYGVYGFCYYHYWFEGKKLLEKPAEIMLQNDSVDLPFCMCWANHTWTKAWAQHNREILMEQTYGGEEDWKKHFEYLLPFFRDKRYIRIDDKPVFVIYRPNEIKALRPMLELWNRLAVESGLKGLTIMYQHYDYNHLKDDGGELFDYGIEFQPGKVKDQELIYTLPIMWRKFKNIFVNKLNLNQTKSSTMWYSYDAVWKRILKTKPQDEKMIPGAFVDFDNTPRYKRRAAVYYGVTPQKFEKYLSLQIKHAKEVYKKDMIFMFAWNEWGEGGYLEPDEKYKYGMLEAIYNALKENNELPGDVN